MTDTVSVSVIIPAYNVAGSLRRCISSVLDQSPAPLEVIVVDDGSGDDSVAVAESFGESVKLLRQSNAGQGAARNTGLGIATGDYIAFLDADDYWAEGFLAATVAFMDSHPDAVAVNTAHIIRRNGHDSYGPTGWVQLDEFQNDTDETNETGETIGSSKGWIIEDFFAVWAEKDHVRTGTVLLRHEILKRAGGQLEELRISQDLEYWGYIATFGQWGFIPQPLWIGDSAAHAASVGWLKRYRKRRRLCPTVDQWQSRLRAAVPENQLAAFRVVRGRVAAGYAQAMILGGRRQDARATVRKFAGDMPQSWSARVMKIGNLIPLIGWPVACGLIHLRELLKAFKAEKAAKVKRVKNVKNASKAGRGL